MYITTEGVKSERAMVRHIERDQSNNS